MRARRADFMISASDPAGFPPMDLPEFAFAGRSNVGKSSLLNALAGVDRLARTSNTPGRTRLINWFRIEPPKSETVAFVDLPGYGYAKVSRDLRDAWRPLVEAYLARTQVLRAVIVLVDARRGAETEERDLLEYLEGLGVTAQVVLTKADKLPKNKRLPAAAAARRALHLARDPLLISVEEPASLEDLWRFIVKRT
jgi:GTP-binding protein